MAAWFSFTKLHLNQLKNFWNNDLWIDETKVEMFGQNASSITGSSHSLLRLSKGRSTNRLQNSSHGMNTLIHISLVLKVVSPLTQLCCL